jgi:hypothetical protein
LPASAIVAHTPGLRALSSRAFADSDKSRVPGL